MYLFSPQDAAGTFLNTIMLSEYIFVSFPSEYAQRYLLGKQVVLWPNQSHWLAAFFTLHSLLSFLATRGKAFGHFNGLSLANSLICKDIFYVCVYATICASLLQSNSISEIDDVLFWVWGGNISWILCALIGCKVEIFMYIFMYDIGFW